jgi:hypothetical protein
MKDVLEREVNVGDEIGFAVGATVVTGKVVRLRTNKHGLDIAKVALHKPEHAGGRYIPVLDENGNKVIDEEYTRRDRGYIYYKNEWRPNPPRHFREVRDAVNKIVLLKPFGEQ